MLSTWMSPQGTGAFASATTIAARCGYADRRPVRCALGVLEKQGYLEIDRREGRTSSYTARFPELVLEEYLVREEYQVSGEDVGLHKPTPGSFEAPGGGTSNDPLSDQPSDHSSGAPAPAPSQATPAQALEQLRKLVAEQKSLDAFALPDAVKAASEESFWREANRLLKVCAQEPAERVAVL
jgi:hypothetical protein